jgi:integrase
MHPIGSVSRAWLDAAEHLETLAPATIASYGAHLASFAAHVGPDRDVGTITSADVESWLRQLKADGMAASTRNTRRTALASFLRWARARQLIDTDPMALVGRARVPRGSVARLSSEEVAAVLAAARRHNGTRLIVLLAVQAFLRRSEIQALTVPDWRRSEGHLEVVHAKGLRSRRVPVSDELAAELDWWLWVGGERRWRVSGPLLPSDRRPGRPLSERAINARVAEAGMAAGVHCWPHLFRHTGISDAAGAGAEPAALAMAAGHADPGTTLRWYVHPSAPEVVAAVAGRVYLG